MARKTEAYVDTSALIAFVDLSDSHGPLFRRLFSDPPALFTTSLVVTEGHQDPTLVDAVGLHLMAQRKTRSCWSTDFHLGLAGVPLVIHEH